jgi:DNA polymerase-3 subunit epsilon
MISWRDFFRKRGFPKAPFVEAYQQLFEERIPKETPISELVFTVLDTETTGLDPRRNELISYGSLQIKAGRILVKTVKEYYFKPRQQNKEAVKIHGIVKKDGFIAHEHFVKEFIADIGNTVVVGHHVGFDKAILEKTGRPFGLKKILNPIIDTYVLGVRLEIGKNYNPRMVNGLDYSLDKLCERYQIPLDDRHTAAGDAFLTAQLLLKLLKKADKVGIKTFGDLLGN